MLLQESVCWQVGGYLPSNWLGGGYLPSSWLGRGGYLPSSWWGRGTYLGQGVPALDGGYLPWMGVPTLDRGYQPWTAGTYLGWCVPTSARGYLPGWGYPLARTGCGTPTPGWDWMRVLPRQDWIGITSAPGKRQQRSTGYTAGSMPFAFTQEDFLAYTLISVATQIDQYTKQNILSLF